MDNTEKKAAFLEELKRIMIKHGVAMIMTGEQGAIYCNVKTDHFSADEADIMF